MSPSPVPASPRGSITSPASRLFSFVRLPSLLLVRLSVLPPFPPFILASFSHFLRSVPPSVRPSRLTLLGGGVGRERGGTGRGEPKSCHPDGGAKMPIVLLEPWRSVLCCDASTGGPITQKLVNVNCVCVSSCISLCSLTRPESNHINLHSSGWEKEFLEQCPWTLKMLKKFNIQDQLFLTKQMVFRANGAELRISHAPL